MGNESSRILGTGKIQSAIITQTQRKPDTEQARCDYLTKKGTKPMANIDKKYGLI